jgi:NAD(P)-dependent dehydrogenase (short-subunit alcohol dehydrogenase family)
MGSQNRFQGQTVAIIGCATGLGNAMARQFAREGARLALADVNEARLAKIADEVRALGAEVVSARTDISNRDDVFRFAGMVRNAFGHVDILCSNAGVADMSGSAWEKTANDWKWVFGVNFFGLVNAVDAFIPDMIERQSGHIVATISNSALVAPANVASYAASKKAALGYCEVLRHDLDRIGSPVIVSAICPGKMISEMPENKLLRPADLAGRNPTGEEIARMKAFLQDGGLLPEEAAERVIDGIAEGRFFILTHPKDAAATVAWASGIATGELAGLESSRSRFRGL